MKRWIVVIAIALVAVAGVSAQDLSGLGRDFEYMIDQLGEELLPDLEQSAIWGQYPGIASYAGQSNFFVSISIGALLTDGLIGFVDNEDGFEVLNVPNLLSGILSSAGSASVSNTVDGLKTFFPLPVARTALGMTLPGEIEAMIEIGGFPGFVSGWVGGLVGADSLRLGLLHAGAKVRKGLVDDAGPFPAISLGGGYAYTSFNFAYDLGTIGTPSTDYGQVSVGLGELNIKGVLDVHSWIHSFGFDLQASKAFGCFVPFVGVSPYYHFASFEGGVGPGNEFGAFIDYDGGGDNQDVTYAGDAPETAWKDNDLSFVLFGGFDMVFGSFVLQLNGSWSVAKGSPGVTLNARWQ